MQFGLRPVTTRLLFSEVLFGFSLLLPLSLIVGQCLQRMAARRKLIRLRTSTFIGGLGCCVVALWLPSVTCLPSDTDPLGWPWLRHRFGLQCSGSNERFRRDATVFLLGIRLIFMAGGLFIGQSFSPVALTGSIATGKSTVGEILLDKSVTDSFRIVDTDRIGHEILLPSSTLEKQGEDGHCYSVSPCDSVYATILKVFGDPGVNNKNILNDDGLIDRRKLGDIVFRDRTMRRALNRITHPRIIRTMLKQLSRDLFFGKESIVCADVPLLFESGLLRWLFTITIVVACDPELQFDRLRTRNPDLTEQQCRDRIASQYPVEKKVALADIVLWNNGNRESLSKEVERVRMDTMERIHGGGFRLSQFLILVGSSFLIAICLDLF